jgi:hypothetical protein
VEVDGETSGQWEFVQNCFQCCNLLDIAADQYESVLMLSKWDGHSSQELKNHSLLIVIILITQAALIQRRHPQFTRTTSSRLSIHMNAHTRKLYLMSIFENWADIS